MKRTLLAAGVSGLLALSNGAVAANLTLNVSQIESLTGDVLVVLYDNEQAYSSSSNPLASRKVPASAETVSTSFEGLKNGEYAIKLYHDENSNGELDTNLIGLPSEAYGFSNNAGRFGPAAYDEAKFTVADDTAISVQLR